MNLKNKPPVLVPYEHRAEIEKLSKAALMDLVWSFAYCTDAGDDATVMERIRRERGIVMEYRK